MKKRKGLKLITYLEKKYDFQKILKANMKDKKHHTESDIFMAKSVSKVEQAAKILDHITLMSDEEFDEATNIEK